MSEKASDILDQVDTQLLQELALLAFNDMTDGAEFALRQTLNALEKRMPEKEFVAFCNNNF